MFKKLLVLLLTVCLAFLPALGAAADGEDVLYKAVSAFNSIGRDMVIPALPFLSTNNGLDMLEAALEKEVNGEDPGLIMGPAIRMALEYTDAETLKKLIASVRLLSEDFRGKVQVYYQRLEELPSSAYDVQGAEIILKHLTRIDSRLPAALEKHQLTTGVIANIMHACAAENGTPPILRLVKGSFEVNYYNKRIYEGLQEIWPDANFAGFLQGVAQNLNESYSTDEKKSVANYLKSVNMLKTDGNAISDGNNGSQTNRPSDTNQPSKPAQPTADSFTVAESGVVRRPYSGTAPVVYKVENGTETPVKLALYIDGQIVAKLSAGQYVVREAAPYFTDCDTWAKSYIETLYARGIVSGKADGCFMPTDTITREEFVKLIVEMFDMLDASAVSSFADVASDVWYAPYVASAEQNGLVSGISSTEFGVGAGIRRQDMAKIISTILEKQGITPQKGDASVLCDYEQIAAYAQPHVLNICRLGIISGDENGYFNPMQFASRQEAAKMIYGMLETLLKTA